jgi:hypothetical protein
VIVADKGRGGWRERREKHRPDTRAREAQRDRHLKIFMNKKPERKRGGKTEKSAQKS